VSVAHLLPPLYLIIIIFKGFDNLNRVRKSIVTRE
jgi:hypothetical protein